MKIQEIEQDPLVEALENWQMMSYDEQDIDIILSDPRTVPFRRAPKSTVYFVYRCLVPGTSIGFEAPSRKFVTYSTTLDGAIVFYESLQTADRFVVVRKLFRPSECIMDFTALYEHIVKPDRFSYYISEDEVWMRNNAFYGRYKESEVVYRSENP